MTERTIYPNAPITEAILDLRIAQPQGLSTDDLVAIHEMVADGYPGREDEHVCSSEVYVEEAGEPPLTDATHQINGFRFTSRDKRRVFYARLDGFALVVRAPYDRWESFRDEARRLWDIYRSVARPEGVIRAGVRYINQLDVAALASDRTSVDLEDYLNVYPATPRSWNFSNFFVQLQLWQEDLHCWVIVNEAPAQLPDQETPIVQLDFDLFGEQFEEPWSADEDTEVWSFLEQLHTRKNQFFESSITEQTRGLIR